MTQVAYHKKVKVSTDQTTWHDLPATSPSLELNADVLDDTNLGTTATGYRSHVTGLLQWSISCDSIYSNGNTALTMVKDAFINRTDLYAQYLPNGTNGHQGKVSVESFSLSGDVGGLETVSITLQSNSALTDV